MIPQGLRRLAGAAVLPAVEQVVAVADLAVLLVLTLLADRVGLHSREQVRGA